MYKPHTVYSAEIRESPFSGKDLVGTQFGRLTVIRLSHFIRHNGKRRSGRWIVSQRFPVWECVCECGKRSFVWGMALRSGRTQSCGCLHKEKLSKMAKKHGESKSILYRRWAGMWTRCVNSHRDFWHRYGNRGISVCDRWRNYELFKQDMGATFRPDLSLERIDNNGPYCAENCRWATASEQQNNTCNNRWLQHSGTRQTVAQWARQIGLSPSTIHNRIRKGWPSGKILMKRDHRFDRNPKCGSNGKFTSNYVP